MPVIVAAFDWDDGNRDKCRKHGVSIAEVEELMRGDVRVAPDLDHSEKEQRFIAIGRTAAGRALFVAFAFRQKDGATLLRPISARYMHKKEVQAYEEKNS